MWLRISGSMWNAMLKSSMASPAVSPISLATLAIAALAEGMTNFTFILKQGCYVKQNACFKK
jgi:predicted lipoprotein with Yx(FWY)xxD motif